MKPRSVILHAFEASRAACRCRALVSRYNSIASCLASVYSTSTILSSPLFVASKGLRVKLSHSMDRPLIKFLEFSEGSASVSVTRPVSSSILKMWEQAFRQEPNCPNLPPLLSAMTGGCVTRLPPQGWQLRARRISCRSCMVGPPLSPGIISGNTLPANSRTELHVD